MNVRLAVVVALGFAGGVTLASCGPTTATCNSSTCGGCCSALGKCETGSELSACGVNGATCGRCGTGTICQSGECRAGTGGGGGTSTGGGSGGGGGTSTGGGSGGGGGGGQQVGCRRINSLTTATSNLEGAGYVAFRNSVGHFVTAQWKYPVNATTFETFRVEVVYPNDVGPLPPIAQNFTNVGYQQCSVCGIYQTECTQGSPDCRVFLAQSGSVSISRVDRAAAGRIVGNASSVRFNEWQLGTDTPVLDGGCIEVTSIGPWDVGWNNDGGMVP